MTPRLTARGTVLLVVATLALALGSARQLPSMVALALVIFGGLLAAFVQFYPAAILLRRRHLELSWWMASPRAQVRVDQAYTIHLAITNQGPRAARVRTLRVAAPESVEILDAGATRLGRAEMTELSLHVRFRAAGFRMLHGVSLELGDALGFFAVDGYFPTTLGTMVWPRTVGASRQTRARAASQQPNGPAQVRLAGTSGDLRELRELTSGDPLKLVAWRASARRQKLMVRDLYEERDTVTAYLVDIGASMRGRAGHAALDWAIATLGDQWTAGISRGERFALATVDTRLVHELPPGTGPRHVREAMERLLDATAIVDEDLTSVSAGELVTRVATYLAYQEGIDVRVFSPPPLDDPRWNSLQVGTNGQLYDLERLDQAVGTLLAGLTADPRRRFAPSWWWHRKTPTPLGDRRLLGLRTYCRLKGIELPYLAHPSATARANALGDALLHLCKFRPESIVLVGTFHDWESAPDVVGRALSHVRHQGAELHLLTPAGRTRFPADDELVTSVTNAWSHQRTTTAIAALRRLGLPRDARRGSRVKRPTISP